MFISVALGPWPSAWELFSYRTLPVSSLPKRCFDRPQPAARHPCLRVVFALLRHSGLSNARAGCTKEAELALGGATERRRQGIV